jgi:hypothetical protein
VVDGAKAFLSTPCQNLPPPLLLHDYDSRHIIFNALRREPRVDVRTPPLNMHAAIPKLAAPPWYNTPESGRPGTNISLTAWQMTESEQSHLQTGWRAFWSIVEKSFPEKKSKATRLEKLLTSMRWILGTGNVCGLCFKWSEIVWS